MVRIKVLFFGQLKDIVGRAQEDLEIAEGSRLQSVFRSLFAPLSAARKVVAQHCDGSQPTFSAPSAIISAEDEVAFLPPVSGGSGPYIHEIRDEPGGHFLR